MSSNSEKSIDDDPITGNESERFDQDDSDGERDGELSQESNEESNQKLDSDSDSEEEPNDRRSQDSGSSSDDEDAPEEVQFSSTRKTAIQLAESQANVLNRIKKQAQEKRKLNQERNVEQKKLKTAASSQASKQQVESDDEAVDEADDVSNDPSDKRSGDPLSIEKETESSRLKIILNVDDQVDRMNSQLIKKYRETNNRMISFKERSIQSNPNIKRTDGSEASRLLHKRRVK